MHDDDHIAAGLESAGIICPPAATKQDIISALEHYLSTLLQSGPDKFWQLLYRLDVPEPAVQSAIKQGENAMTLIAELIYNRQLQKISLHVRFPKDYPSDPDLEW